MKSRLLAVVLASVMFVAIHPTAQAGVVNIQGYSCDNTSSVEKDIQYLENELPRIRKNSFVQGQVRNEIHRLKAEKQMLKIICKTEDDSSFIIVTEDTSKEY